MADYQGVEIFDNGVSKYRRDVKTLLDAIAGNPAGGALLKAIAAANKDKGKKVDLEAYRQDREDLDAGVHGRCNAITEESDPDAAHPEGGPYYLGHSDNPATRDKDERYDKSKTNGTGKGSNTWVHYSPEIWGKDQACSRGAYAAMPDEILFHELIHALRDLQGQTDETPTTGKLLAYKNESEFLAIVITNVYVSSKYKGDAAIKNLRADHDGHTALAPPLNTSEGFLKDPDNQALLKKFAGQKSLLPFLQDVAHVAAAFNPIKPLIIKPPPPPQPTRPAPPPKGRPPAPK